MTKKPPITAEEPSMDHENPVTDEPTTTTDEVAETQAQDVLVEEVSIDGMCGVY